MIEKIKQLRVDIDATAQAVKSLKPFKWISVTMDNEGINLAGEFGKVEFIGLESPLNQMRDQKSLSCSDDSNKYKHHSLIRTDRGLFRLGSNIEANPHEAYTVDQNSKEINKAVDSLYLAKAWLGKMLGSKAVMSPYRNDGKRKVVSDIEDTAERFSGTIEIKEDQTHIERVDAIRQEIKLLSGDFNSTVRIDQEMSKCLYAGNVRQHLSEARFWLGFELERIKNTDK